MPFVKLDTGILVSTLWIERDLREVFITALLMAEPFELESPSRQIEVRSLANTDFIVPPGWYGMVQAAGIGIIDRAGVERESGFSALEKLGSPDLESRTHAFEGRRMVRVDGGFIILNYMKYRDRDYTAADRMRRLRARRKEQNESTVRRNSVTLPRNVTQADSREQIAEADTEALKAKPKSKSFVPPTLEEVDQYCQEKKSKIDPVRFWNYYTANGWRVGRNPMKNWKSAVATWERNPQNGNNASRKDWTPPQNVGPDYVPESVKRRRELEQARLKGL